VVSKKPAPQILEDTTLDQLLIGSILIVVSVALVFLCRPRNGKKAWFVDKPFLAPLVSIVIVTGLALGVFMIAAQFSTIDDGAIGQAKVRKL
jgi:uncharacterized membrane protein YidH (DUF202 family)